MEFENLDDMAEKYGFLCDYIYRNFLDISIDDGFLHTSSEARKHSTAIFDLLDLR